jgi:hypothetical protein
VGAAGLGGVAAASVEGWAVPAGLAGASAGGGVGTAVGFNGGGTKVTVEGRVVKAVGSRTGGAAAGGDVTDGDIVAIGAVLTAGTGVGGVAGALATVGGVAGAGFGAITAVAIGLVIGLTSAGGTLADVAVSCGEKCAMTMLATTPTATA